MTTIEFRTGLPDKHAYLCKLLRVVWRKGQSAVVLAPSVDLPTIDALLWQFDAASFIAHTVLPTASPNASPNPSQRTMAPAPVLLCSALTSDVLTRQVQTLVHLGSGVPAGFESFDRLIELVGLDATDVQHGRERWKHYKSRAYPLQAMPYQAG